MIGLRDICWRLTLNVCSCGRCERPTYIHRSSKVATTPISVGGQHDSAKEAGAVGYGDIVSGDTVAEVVS